MSEPFALGPSGAMEAQDLRQPCGTVSQVAGGMSVKVIARPSKGESLSHCKTWRLSWELPPTVDPDGKTQRQQLTETFHGTKREAEDRWAARDTEIRQGKGDKPAGRRTCGEYLDSWLKARDGTTLKALKPTTRLSYGEIIRLHLIPRLGAIRLTELRPDHIRDLLRDIQQRGRKDGRGETLSPRRVRYVHAVLRAALRQAVRDGYLAQSPAERIRPPQAAPKVVRAFSIEEARRIEAAAANHRLAPLFTVAWQVGLRRGEILGLRWENVDLSGRRVRVAETLVALGGKTLHQDSAKTEEGSRSLRLTVEAAAVLRRHQERQQAEKAQIGASYRDGGLVFASEVGTPTSPANLERLWRQIKQKAGVPDYPLHSLRHTCATLLLSAGWPLPAVAEQLGHKDYAFTKNVYGHIAPELLDRLIGDFDSYLAGRAV